jgi:uncharacterized protein YjbJ (UPF0337 family)
MAILLKCLRARAAMPRADDPVLAVRDAAAAAGEHPIAVFVPSHCGNPGCLLWPRICSGRAGSILPGRSSTRPRGQRRARALLQPLHFTEGVRAMNWDRVQGNWKQLRGKIKEQWGELTDDHLDQIDGKRDQLVGRVQEKYGIARDEAERQVTEWESRQSDV